jgi:hypothetical protein
MKAVAVVVGLLVLLLMSACIEDVGEPSKSPTPAAPTASVVDATRPAGTPSAGTPACAAGSTDGFLQAQSHAPFKVYCPTFLPAGFALEDVRFQLSIQSGTPAPGPGSVVAIFTRGSPKATLQFVQGRPELSLITELRASSEGEPTDTPYADFEASLFDKGVLARSPDGYTHVITADGLTTDDLKKIAAGMLPVAP